MTNIIEGPEFESTEDRSFGVFFFEQAEKYKNRICQINGDTGKKETFQEVKTKSTRLAMSMIEHGIKKNDVVVCCISNNEHNAIPVIATLYLGAKIASLDPTLSARDSNHLIKLVAPKIIFVEESALHLIEENMDTFVKNTKIVVVGKSEKYLQYSDMIKPKPGENSFAPTSVDCREGAVIFFSSGSTGLPKGIELTHFGLFYSVYSLLAMEFLKPDVMLHFTSLYWISAFIVLSLNHIAGTSRVTCAQPSGEKIFQIIQDYKVSFTFASPTIGHLLTNVPNFGDYDTSSLFSVMLGGCAANLPQLEKIRSVLPHSNISYAYGMTECSFISGFNYKTENEIHKKKSSGKIVSGLKVKINGDTGKKETFQEVKTKCTRLAIAMKDQGITQGDVIVSCISNNENNVIPLISALYLGAKIASLDPTLSSRDCKHLINLVSPKMIFVEENCVDLIEESIDETKNITIVVIGKSIKYLQFYDMILPKPNEGVFKPLVVDCNEGAIIFFSSGTTGLPKGIENTHSGLISVVNSLCYGETLNPDVVLHFTSLYWITAVVMLILNHMKGTIRVTSQNIDGEAIFRIIEDYKVSFLVMSPTISYALTSMQCPEKYDSSSLFSAYIVGASINMAQLEKVRNYLPHTRVVLCYGMTETSSYVTVFDFERDGKIYSTKSTSSGKLLPGIEMKIVDPKSEKLLGPNESGEIRIWTPNLMKGYYNADSSNTFDSEGFLKTGDIGYFDEDEYIYIVDRIKEMFKYKSWHIVPASLETVIFEHPDVKEAVVFGIPHDEDGYHPAALVIPHKNAQINGEDIERFVAKRVIDRQRLRGGVYIVDSIPKTATGKISRGKVQQAYLNKL